MPSAKCITASSKIGRAYLIALWLPPAGSQGVQKWSRKGMKLSLRNSESSSMVPRVPGLQGLDFGENASGL